MPATKPDQSLSMTSALQETLTLILAGGQGARLKPLTSSRAKPAVPFGGAYRIIDFTLSNCIHSGLRRIYVLTQYEARSLDEHIRFGWNFLPRRLGQFISVSPPHHQSAGKWYEGTADAIYQNIAVLRSARPKNVLILSGDHIYKMDYGRMLREHIESDAALTIGAVRISAGESGRFGILETSPSGRVQGFQEKPDLGAEIPGDPGHCLGSMGIYIFRTEELIRRLRADAELGPASSHDFGNDIIPRMIEETHVQAHHFVDEHGSKNPYWRDVGTIESYVDANLDLCNVEPHFNLYDTRWPTYTLWHNNPPAKAILNGEINDSLLCPGVVVSGACVERSVLSYVCRLDKGSRVESSILFTGVEVGEGAQLKNTIVDKWTKIPPGTLIGQDREQDAQRFKVTESGIVLVPGGYQF